MYRMFAALILLVLSQSMALAAGVGDRCKIGNNVSNKYLCQIGKPCLQAISKRYCSHAGKVCGWPDRGGYSLGAKKNHNGNKYVCTLTGTNARFKKVSETVTIPNVTTLPTNPSIRGLSNSEVSLAKSVYKSSLNYNMVKVTNTVGLGSRPWTTNTPPLYTINVGVEAYKNLATGHWKSLLIHELGHVWQGQHFVPFMSNSAAHQILSAIQEGGNPGGAYSYKAGKQWNKYNVEQQASIVTAWYRKGRKTSHALYPYIRDNIRPGKPNANTKFVIKKR